MVCASRIHASYLRVTCLSNASHIFSIRASHSFWNTKRKMNIFGACVATRLMYGIQTACVNKVERRRLDGFHARCLRRILKIPPAYFSRVSNAVVWERARVQCLSVQLLQQQLLYFGKLAVADSGHPCREPVFQEGGVTLRCLNEARRVRRPRLEWATEMYHHAVKAVGPNSSLTELFRTNAGNNPLREWRQHVHTYVHSM